MDSLGFFRSINIVVFIAALGVFTFVTPQKIKVEEVIAKHLESIGASDDRSQVKNQTAAGFVQYTVLRQGTGGDGKIVISSEGNKLLYGMTFAIPSYPAETIVFDGRKARIAFAISNARSQFGDFIYRYNKDVVAEGLFGGTLSSGWALASISDRKAKVELNSRKKVNGRDTYVLKYYPKGGSDLEIYIYIDQETYQHLRTEYRRIISARQGLTPDSSSQQREQRQTMIEEFFDYKKVNNLNLPHSYRAYFMLSGAAGTREHEYKVQFTDFFFNQELDPNSFDTESK